MTPASHAVAKYFEDTVQQNGYYVTSGQFMRDRSYEAALKNQKLARRYLRAGSRVWHREFMRKAILYWQDYRYHKVQAEKFYAS